MPAFRRRNGTHHARRTGADNGNFQALFRLRRHFGENLLKCGARIDGALRVAALDKLIDTALLTADAGRNLRNAACARLVWPLRIRQQRAGKHDHIALSVAQCLLRQIGITQLTYGDHGNFHTRIGKNLVFAEVVFCELRDVQKAAGRH